MCEFSMPFKGKGNYVQGANPSGGAEKWSTFGALPLDPSLDPSLHCYIFCFIILKKTKGRIIRKRSFLI